MTNISKPTNPVPENWHTRAFGELYPIIYAHRTVEAAAPEAAFAIQYLPIQSNHRVLDLCCGTGRHMVHLLKQTPHVTGLDYSPDLLALAQTQLPPGTSLVRADMRALPFLHSFDVITNFFTSFGYFSESANRQSLLQWARALRPGGRFLLDHINAHYVRATLRPHSERSHDGLSIQESRWLDHGGQRINKQIRVFRQNALIHQSEESVCLFTPDQLLPYLSGVGLEIDAIYGNYSGQPMAEDQPRMIVIGHRKTAHDQRI